MKRSFFIVFMVLALGLTMSSTALADITIGTTSYGTIAEALEAADDGETIELTAGTYWEKTVTGYTAALRVTQQNLTITSTDTDPANTIIQAAVTKNTAGAGRVFEIAPGASVTIENVTIQNGKAPDGEDGIADQSGEDGGNGGGIYNEGSLTLNNCTVKDNYAGDGGKGGLGSNGQNSGTLGQTGTAGESGGTAAADGGNGGIGGNGIDGEDGNPGGTGGIGGNGGAIYNAGSGTLTLNTVTITGNECGNGGNGGFGGLGGNGSNGGYGGDGGAAGDSTDNTNIGGVGGVGGTGANGGTGGAAGSGGTGGSGGGIYNAGLLNDNTSSITANSVGIGGTGGNPGAGGAGGKGGTGGSGGWNVVDGEYDNTRNDGGDGGKGGDGGASGGATPGGTGADGTTVSGSPYGGSGGSGGDGGTLGTSGSDGSGGMKSMIASVPTVTTVEPSNTTSTTTDSGGNVTDDGGEDVTAKGVCWSQVSKPTVDGGTCTDDGTGTDVFSSSVAGLTESTEYYLRAYATNSDGTAYGAEFTFSTLGRPTVTTVVPTDITSVTATSGGNVTDDGGGTVTARGVVWNVIEEPTLANSLGSTMDGQGTGIFESAISGLSKDVTYHVRAYATNSEGTEYGDQYTFETPDTPTVTTASITEITTNSANSGGNVTSSGGADVTEKGLAWSMSTISDSAVIPSDTIFTKQNASGGVGVFTMSMTGLYSGQEYYVRAYAINSAGTAFGEQLTLETEVSLPVVITGEYSNVTSTVARLEGDVKHTGGAATERGICWKTEEEYLASGNPTTDDSKELHDLQGAGAFSILIEEFQHSTTYYYRAYATNTKGTTYGDDVIFETKIAEYPKVTTDGDPVATDLDKATMKGTATSVDGTPISDKGFCWNTIGVPMIGGDCVSAGSGTGAFEEPLAVTSDKTYYIRAYAQNTRGTAYGNQVKFKASEKPGVVTDSVINVAQTSADAVGTITIDPADVITTIASRGVCWSVASVPDATDITSDTCASNGEGTGSFTVSISQLTMDTTYYVRAYAVTNLDITVFDDGELTFKTTAGPDVKTLSTVTNITATSATVTGDVTGDNGSEVTARGVCWTTDEGTDPTTDGSCAASDTGGTGEFTINITELSAGEKYYARAYATNDVDTGYGETVAFETTCIPGDVDNSGVVDLTDAIVALKILSGEPGATVCLTADVNGDDKIGIEEVIYILRQVLG